jgi:DUF438 domain-containing protein
MPGELPKDVMIKILAILPLDITYVDERDIIRYYSDYRIFKRTPGILGLPVQSCHQPGSRDEVNRVIDDLRSGRKEVSEHTAEKDGCSVRVRYVTVKDEKGRYAGLVEIVEWVA